MSYPNDADSTITTICDRCTKESNHHVIRNVIRTLKFVGWQKFPTHAGTRVAPLYECLACGGSKLDTTQSELIDK